MLLLFHFVCRYEIISQKPIRVKIITPFKNQPQISLDLKKRIIEAHKAEKGNIGFTMFPRIKNWSETYHPEIQ